LTALTHRFARAVDYARIAHGAQFRKGSDIPYIYHLLGVSSLVIEYGGNEDQAIAGLLHDVLEDCGKAHIHSIRAEFGDGVARIVDDCTDGTPEDKGAAKTPEEKRENWMGRKIKYLAHMQDESKTSLLVTGCDKLHNVRAILTDLENPNVGTSVFGRFTGGREGTLGYYESISRVLNKRKAPMAHAFDAAVARIHVLADNAIRKPLQDVSFAPIAKAKKGASRKR
jgi:(p)ppGpp synthase/HD superfamily hydrolase